MTNRVTLIGNVGKEVELLKSSQNLSIANFSVATTKKNKAGEDVTQWHNCTAFGKTADAVAHSVKKGARVMIEGEIQYSQYEKEGIKRTSTKIIVNTIAITLKIEQEAHQSTEHAQTHAVVPTLDKKHVNYDYDEVPF